MIRYALACDDGHQFDSWFRDSAAYDAQRDAAQLACPTCGSTAIAKTIMAPAVVGTRAPVPAEPMPNRAASEAPTESPTVDVALADDKSREMRAMVRAFREKLFAEGHDVGARFAAEARKMHDGDIPHRQIYGQASIAEARDLLEDGIVVLPLPTVPDDLN